MSELMIVAAALLVLTFTILLRQYVIAQKSIQVRLSDQIEAYKNTLSLASLNETHAELEFCRIILEDAQRRSSLELSDEEHKQLLRSIYLCLKTIEIAWSQEGVSFSLPYAHRPLATKSQATSSS
jgi:hypothetical protein